MKIYVISNTLDKQRSENIIRQFESQTTKFEYEIVEAVMNSSQPSVGILQSFKKCIALAKKACHAEILVSEDDFTALTPTALADFINIWNKYALNDGILLGGVYEGNIKDQYEDDELLPFSTVEGKIAGLSCCIVSENHYDTILQAEEGYHLDYSLSMIFKIPLYVVWPFSVIQGNFESSNQNNMKELNKNLHLKYKLANGE